MSELRKPYRKGAEEPIPAGLEYKAAYWDSALAMIEAHDKVVFRRKLYAAAAVVLLAVITTVALVRSSHHEGMKLIAQEDVLHATAVKGIGSGFSEQSVAGDGGDEGVALTLGGTEVDAGNDHAEGAVVYDGGEMSHTANGEEDHLANATLLTHTVSLNETGEETENSDQHIHYEHLRTTVHTSTEEHSTAQQQSPIPLNIKLDEAVSGQSQNSGTPARLTMPRVADLNGQELALMVPKPWVLLAQENEIRKPQGVIVNLKPRKLLLPLQQFNVQVMLGTSILTHYGSRKQNIGSDPVAGIGADYNFRRRMNVRVGFEYFSVSGILRDRVVVQEAFDFAQSTRTFNYNTTKLHYLSVPVSVGYRLGSRHMFNAGLGIEYLLAANNTVTVQEENPLKKTEVSQFEADNIPAGFAPVSGYALGSYHYYVTPNISLGLNYQFGLNDVTLDGSGLFNNNTKDRNTRLAVNVRFNVY